MAVVHKYKEFNLVKTGTSSLPWNIYFDDGYGFGTLVGSGYSLSDCKGAIDDDVKRIKRFGYL